jgi:hypothetical protein
MGLCRDERSADQHEDQAERGHLLVIPMLLQP